MRAAPLLRPEFGPTLPELLSRRLSISRRAITIAAVVLLVLIIAAIKVALGIGRDTVTVNGSPSFSVVYKTGLLHRAPLRPGEVLRLQGKRTHVAVALTARRLVLPPFKGDVVAGQLPVYITTYTSRLQTQLPHFAVTDEGKARINLAQGYDVGYQSGVRGHRTYWREIFLLPDSTRGDQIVVLRLAQTFSGPTGPRGQALVAAVKQAYQSFRFGSRRPFFSPG